jgi:polyisoprenyl-phosphate glycosyltransferase
VPVTLDDVVQALCSSIASNSPMTASVHLSIVTSAFNEEEVLREFLARTCGVLDGLPAPSELIVVDDGSSDATWGIVQQWARRDARVRGLRLSRNFGHQVALTAGLSVAEGSGVVTLDADLQHPPELIPDLLQIAEDGYDVVYAVRTPDDAEGLLKRLSAKLFYWLLNRLTSLELPEGAADFRFMSRRVVDALLSMPERHRFLRGMTRWTGFEQTVMPYRRESRGAGRSTYTARRMVLLAWDAVVSFSSFPLRIASVAGVGISLVGAFYLAYVICARLVLRTAVPGWTSLAAAVLVLGGAQLVFLGIIGQYLGRMYDDVKGRPLFFVASDTRTESSAGESAPASSGAPESHTVH